MSACRPAKSNDIAGLVSFMRNIGSSIGTSMVTTLLARDAQFHQVHLVAHATPGDPAFTAMVSSATARLIASGAEASQAAMQAQGLVYQRVIAQASVLAYIDTFRILAVGAGDHVPVVLCAPQERARRGCGGADTLRTGSAGSRASTGSTGFTRCRVRELARGLEWT